MIETFLFICAILVIICMIWILHMHIKGPAIPRHITYDGPPQDNCPDCHGIGIIMKDDEYFETECPCRQVLHY